MEIEYNYLSKDNIIAFFFKNKTYQASAILLLKHLGFG